MKDLKDFKGSDLLEVREIRQDDVFELIQPDIQRTIAIINFWDGKREKAQANARLFANSKKVLEAAIKAHGELKRALTYEGANAGGTRDEISKYVAKNVELQNLEQAINDSL